MEKKDDDVVVHIPEKQREEWGVESTSKCGVDKELIIYGCQMTVLATLLAYSTVMMASEDTCEERRNWMSLITMIIGIVCPTPKMK